MIITDRVNTSTNFRRVVAKKVKICVSHPLISNPKINSLTLWLASFPTPVLGSPSPAHRQPIIEVSGGIAMTPLTATMHSVHLINLQ